MVRKIDANSMQVEASDGRTLTLQLGSQTVIRKDGTHLALEKLTVGSKVTLEAIEDREGKLTAKRVTVTELGNGTNEGQAQNDAGEDSANGDETGSFVFRAPSPDSPNRPHLHRGKPTGDENSGADDASPGAPLERDSARPVEPHAKLIEDTRRWVREFSQHLPNYVCQQVTTRYEQTDKLSGWHALDVVTANVAYEAGEEKYQNISVNGRKVNKPMMEIGGSTSSGEYGTTLRSLFHPRTHASFKFFRSAMWHGVATVIYDVTVSRATSDWDVFVPSQQIRPSYTGSVWIDPKTFHVLRVEKQATAIPDQFPLDSVEWAVEYGPVRLNGQEYWLPTGAETLSCERGTSRCSKNTTEFRNYHAFTSDSTITFNDNH